MLPPSRTRVPFIRQTTLPVSRVRRLGGPIAEVSTLSGDAEPAHHTLTVQTFVEAISLCLKRLRDPAPDIAATAVPSHAPWLRSSYEME